MDEKQLQLLYNEYGQSHGFKDYSEFKSLMSDGKSRELFFNETNKELGFKDYNEFNHILGYDSKEVQQQAQNASLNASATNIEPNAGMPSRGEFINQKLQPEANQFPSRNELLTQHKTSQQELAHFGVHDEKPITESTQDIQQQQTLNAAQAKERGNDRESALNNAIEQMAQRNAGEQYGADFLKNDIKQKIQDGKLVPVEQSDGTFALKQGADIGQSFIEGLTRAHQQGLENNFLVNANRDTKLEYLNRIREHPETRIVQESKYASNGIGGQLSGMIGENTELMEKGTIGALGFGLTELTGGASAGSFLAMAQDFTNSGYSQGLTSTYSTLKDQNPKMSDEEALAKAEKVASVSSAVSLATGALLSKASPEATEGLVKAFGQTIKSSPKVLGATALGSVATDLTGMAVGEKKSAEEIFGDAGEATKNMAVLHGLMAMPHIAGAAVNEVLNIPNNIKPQIENVAASLPREEVKNFYQNAENNGQVPEGTTEKIVEHLNNFDEHKKVVEDLPIEEEQKAVIASRLTEQKITPNERANTIPEEKIQEETKKPIIQTNEGGSAVNEPLTAEEGGIAKGEVVENKQGTEENKVTSNWNYNGEADFLDSKGGETRYVQRILGDRYNKASQKGELDTTSEIDYEVDNGGSGVTAYDKNGIKIGEIKIEYKTSGVKGIEHLVVAPEFRGKGIARKMLQMQKEAFPKMQIDLAASKQRSPKFAEWANKVLSETPKQTLLEDNNIVGEPKENLKDYNTFRNKVFEQLTEQKDSSFDYRITSEISQKEREKGIADIKAGKNTAAAKKVEGLVKEIYDSGVITLNRGRGNNAETVQFPHEQWFNNPLSQKEIDAIEKVEPLAATIIKSEGITADNIDNFKHLFDGFPYYETDFQAVKDYLAGQGERNNDVKPIGEEIPPSQSSQAPTENISQPINTEQNTATQSEPEIPQPKEVAGNVHVDHPKTILTHRGLQEIATEIGGEDVTPRERESRLAQLKEADNNISEWQEKGTYDKNINDIIDRAKKGHIDEVEQKILANHLATLREERRAITDKNSKAFKDKTAEVAQVIDAAKTMRSKAGGLLGDKAFGNSIPKDYSNPISVQESVEHVTGEPINSSQQKRIEELTTENAALKKQAEDAEKLTINETDKELNSGSNKIKGASKKAHEDYVKERNDSFQAARDALKKLRTGQSGLGASIPLVRELTAVAPHIAKIVKSLIDEGVDKLGDIVDYVHEELSKDMTGLRRRDVADLIAGQYLKQEDKTPEINKYSDIKKQAKLVQKLEDLQNGLLEDFNSNKTEQSPAVKKLLEQIKKVKKDLAAIGYMKEKPAWQKEPLTAEEKNINRLQKELDNLYQGIAKQISPSRELTKREKELQEQIRDEREKLGLVKSKQEKPLTEQEQKEADETELSGLQKQFENRSNKDKKITPDEAKSLWNYAKKNYIDKGISYADAVQNVSDDTGLTFQQVATAFETPKTKGISNVMWAKNNALRRSKIKINEYVEQQNENPIVKFVKKVASYPRSIVTFGHGHIYAGTHYPMGFVTPSQWGTFFNGIGKMWRNAYGKEAYHAKEIKALSGDKNYILAKRAGLQNDVENTSSDDFEKGGKIFGYLGRTGTKGFLGLKWTRQQMFNTYWDGLPANQQTEAVAKEVAQLINLATGASNLKISPVFKEGLFSAQMEAARWGRLFRNPARAVQAVTRISANAIKGEEILPQDKVFLKIWGSRVGQQLATMTAVLGANAFIQSKLNPKNPVNLTDPTKSDFMKLKAGETDVDLSGGVLGVKSFLTTIGTYAINDKSYKQEVGDIGGKSLGYIRGKLSPLYGDISEVVLGTDYAGNPLPFSTKKPTVGHHQLSWKEYLFSKAPIPVADAAANMFDNADMNGLPKTTTDKIVDGLIESSISFGAGVHTTPSYKQQTPYSDDDKKDPTFKYFLDKGMELPNTSLSSEEITDEDSGTKKKISDYPKDIQDKYQDAHKQALKEELASIKDDGTVYVKYYKDAKGNKISDVSLNEPTGDYKEVSVDKLSKEELAQVLHLAQSQATTKAKEQIFNPQETQ